MWLGKRRIIRRIGVGGMGDVYLAEEPYLNRQVAIKVIRGEIAPNDYGPIAKAADAQRRFAQEARAVAALDHPNILPLFDYGEQDGLHYLVMPYVQDGSLAELLARDPQRRFSPPLAPALAAQIVAQTAAALQYAHERGIVHRDVKPHNLLARLSASPSVPLATVATTAPTMPNIHILLADFGVARFMEELSSQTGATGTPLYSPPEQFAGRPVYASDQYALACVAYLLLTGQPAFRGSIVELYHQHLSVAPTPPSQLNPALNPVVDGVIVRALAKQPQDRFPRVEQFAQALTDATQGASAFADQPPPDVGMLDTAKTTPARPATPAITPATGVTPITSITPVASAVPITPFVAPADANRSTGLLAPTPYGAAAAPGSADGSQSAQTELDMEREQSVQYTVPDTARALGAQAAYAPTPERPAAWAPVEAPPLPASPQRGAKRPPQRALLLALAVAVVVAALAGLGVATHGFAALHGLGVATARTPTQTSGATHPTPTKTAAPTAVTRPTALPGFTILPGDTFVADVPTGWYVYNAVDVNFVQANGYIVSPPGQPPFGGAHPSVTIYESYQVGETADVEQVFSQMAPPNAPLGAASAVTIAGVSWLQRTANSNGSQGSETAVYLACIHHNFAYLISFTSWSANYDSDYAAYYHAVQASFTFTQ